jgi:hypothetical protein
LFLCSSQGHQFNLEVNAMTASTQKSTSNMLAALTCFILFALFAGPLAKSASLNRDKEVILIWKIGSPHTGETPSPEIPNELQTEAANLGYRLEIKTFPAVGFADRFFLARVQNEEPDILAIDNWGLITGIRTNLGIFEGIGADKKVRDSLVDVAQSLSQLVPQGGWQLLVTSSKNHSAARTLALRELKCDPVFSSGPSSDQDKDVRSNAEKAATSFFGNDIQSLNSLADGKYPDGAANIDQPTATIRQVKTCGTWANQRLAFVSTSLVFERRSSNERGSSIGRRDIVTILSKANSRWQLLHLFESDRVVRELLATLPLYLRNEGGATLAKPTWLTPSEESAFLRFPSELRPVMEWTRATDGKVIYLLETQLRDAGKWFQNRFKLISEPGDEATIKLQAPHTVGAQPHRSRVWAIDPYGDITVSDWRVINYRN